MVVQYRASSQMRDPFSTLLLRGFSTDSKLDSEPPLAGVRSSDLLRTPTSTSLNRGDSETLDNCPVHKARVVQRWFEERREQIELLPWPALSPDLNPIENVLARIVNAWKPENERTRAHLLQHTKDEWERFRRNQQTIYNIVSSAPDRVQAVIEADGHWTAY
ncbi:hypothetical protein Pcinc_017709 [Petrolisthes cinctipes]|uniref:Tc1-like transposase DDE domain-containing protein n=1 Tax=Petrolisthes cinctipes TaxID=88211 RepID=A0AAE1FQ66_PETCI|nr:hypothetical protein Pcinc_017709 [Petrolisthes cinctipes]